MVGCGPEAARPTGAVGPIPTGAAMTLRTRIAAVAGVSVALAVLAAAIGLYLAVRADLRGEVDKGLRDRAQLFANPPGGVNGVNGDVLRRSGGVVLLKGAGGNDLFDYGAKGGPPVKGQAAPGPQLAGPGASGGGFPSRVRPAPFGGASGYVQFIEPSGRVQVPGGQGSSSATIAIDASDRAIARRGVGSALRDITVKGTRLRVLTDGIGGRGAVLVARPLGEVNSELSKLLLILAIVGAAGIALAAALGAVVARVALAPISRFTARTETLIARSAPQDTDAPEGVALDLSQRLEVKGRDELGRLAESFNRTLDALERSIGSQRQLVADAGHELRTPIASLRANIQVLGEAERLPEADREALRQDIVSELDELTALVGDVVELARGTSPDGQPDEVRLDMIVTAAVERTRRRMGEIRFELELEPAVITGSADRIDRAVSNLLENAAKWSSPAGSVEVGLHGGVLSVRDHGPGFDEQDLPHVFDRFYRADRARELPGSGLGLAIVRQAAEAAGGFARAENAPGGGALLTVSFGAPLDLDPPAEESEPLRPQASAPAAPKESKPAEPEERRTSPGRV